jgi:hypothetical protein
LDEGVRVINTLCEKIITLDLVALFNIHKYNNIVNNTKEYKLIKRKDKAII